MLRMGQGIASNIGMVGGGVFIARKTYSSLFPSFSIHTCLP